MKQILFITALLFVGHEAFAELSDATLSSFNYEIANYLSGRNVTSEKIRKILVNPRTNKAKLGLLDNKILKVAANGTKICAIRSSKRRCWQPVFEGKKVGLLFDGKTKAFFPTSLERKVFDREFAKYLNPKETRVGLVPDSEKTLYVADATDNWTRLGLSGEPELPDHLKKQEFNATSIPYEERSLYIATAEGWQKLMTMENSDQIVADFVKNPWSNVKGNKISCTADGASVTITSPDASGKEYQISRHPYIKGGYYIFVNGKKYIAKFITLNNGENEKICSESGDFTWQSCSMSNPDARMGFCPDKGGECQPASAAYGYIDYSFNYICLKGEKFSCRNPLPEESLIIDRCIGEACWEVGKNKTETMPDAQLAEMLDVDIAPLSEASSRVKTIRGIEKNITDIYPDANLSPEYRDFPSGVSNLSASTLSKLKRLYLERKDQLERMDKENLEKMKNGALKVRERMSELQKNIINVDRASKCCASDKCKVEVYDGLQKNVDTYNKLDFVPEGSAPAN